MQRIVAILLVLVALAGGFFIGTKYMPGGNGPGSPTPTPIAGTDTPSGPTPAPAPAGEVVTPAKAREPYTAPKEIDFAFRRLEIETTGDQPEACLVFTRDFVADGSVRYEDYLQFDPGAQIAVRPSKDRLCIAGLQFNQTYALTIRAGLPAASGEKTAEDETIPVQLRDQDPTVAFGAGFILPRDSADGVPVTTVNVDAVSIKVIRVGDRLLSQLQDYVLDQREIYEYDAGTYENSQGSTVWSGEMAVANVKNQAVTTSFAITDALPAMKPGVYLILAKDKNRKEGDDEYWTPMAGQWIINTDIALTSFKAYDGLTVFARSFATATPQAGVKLQLVAQNNEILGEGTTESDGKVVFEGGLLRGAGGDTPAVVMAYNGDGKDFAYIDLRRSAFDLSDRGVDGRAAAGNIDGFVYLDRGIYRPGETVHLNALLRDRETNAIPSAPVTVIVSKPDGQEFRRYTVDQLMAGGLYQPFTLSASAPRGRWSAAVYTDPNGSSVGYVAFDVQDFVPQKLKVELATATTQIDPAQPVSIDVTSRFLYGAPASGLGGEGTLTLERAGEPYAKFKDWSFGSVDETWDPQQVTLDVGTTDAEGKTTATGSFDGIDLSQTTIPLEAKADVKIYEPGGRTTGETIVIPVKTRPLAIGIRAGFDYATVAENSDANFEIVAVDDKGEPVALKGATYEFVRESVDYRWYQTDGEWKYDRIVRDRIVNGGKLDVAADAPAKLGQRVDWGSYRLTIADPATGARTSVRFWAGWGASASDRPDRLNVSSDKQAYKSGDTAVLNVRAVTDGKGLVVIAGDRVFETREIDIKAEGTTLPIEVKKEWGAGVYALVTMYRPLDAATKGSPRAIGLVHLAIDASDRTLAVDVGTPERMLPRGPLSVPITVANASGEGYVTVAAIDEGVLQLTDFPTPDPVKYFFGKRRLGVDIRDDYGRLIETTRYQVGELRTGGDSLGGRGLAVVPQKVVALYSGPVKLEGGKATVTLDVPDFNGELRVMAVAWTPTAVGFGSKPVTVRDPVVAELVLPRFLAPGDVADVGFNLHNVDGAPGAYTAEISATDPVGVDPGSARIERTLAAGERQLLPVKINASSAGIATIKLAISGPNGFKVDRIWPIEVRPAQLPMSIGDVAQIQPGASYALPATILSSFTPGSASVQVTLSGARGFDNVAGMLKWLDKYPYGCLEQTTSRALPLVYLNDLAKLAGLEEEKRITDRVQEAADRVLDMQRPDGGFGMWSSSYNDDADKFLQVYATDFLMQAKAKGYVIPEEGLTRALRYLRQVATDESNSDNARAYAFYVLARGGQGQVGDLRYYADNAGANAASAISQGFIGGALVQAGDRSRAGIAFGKAREIATSYPIDRSFWRWDRGYYDYYGSALRDVAGLTAVAADAKEDSLIPALLDKVNGFDTNMNYTTTQEKSWMLLAQWRLLNSAPPVKAEVTGTTAAESSGQVVLRPALNELSGGVAIRNAGDRAIWRTVSATGVPANPLPPSAEGVTIRKTYRNLDGSAANMAALRQNDQVIVVIEGNLTDRQYHQLAVTDLLPAGFEIEGAVQVGESGSSIYPWLGDLTYTSIQENRDDRYVAAFSAGSAYRMSPEEEAKTALPNFRLAYIARATVPGTFALPAAMIEDMYVPTITGRSAMSSVTIAAQ
ncbi:MAG: alpha-2-macroglobulin family protein [Alphaproteobacteria bacterium]|nr:alpha-2-macroglobulin family protein [Alphaproteobacteria bacterium]